MMYVAGNGQLIPYLAILLSYIVTRILWNDSPIHHVDVKWLMGYYCSPCAYHLSSRNYCMHLHVICSLYGFIAYQCYNIIL